MKGAEGRFVRAMKTVLRVEYPHIVQLYNAGNGRTQEFSHSGLDIPMAVTED